MKPILYSLSLIYGAIVSLRGLCYRLGLLRIYKFKTPIISIGNVAVGGTGKTPMVIYFSRFLTTKKIKHVIISRGYKKTSRGTVVVQDYHNQHIYDPAFVGDEPLVLAKKLPGIPVVVDNKKHRGIKRAILDFGPQLLLLDDGFQSLYIQKSKEYVLIDTSRPATEYNLIPRGILRESLLGLKRADVVVFVKKNIVESGRETIQTTIKPLLKKHSIPFINASFKSSLYIHNYNQQRLDLSSAQALISRSFLAMSGVGSSESFVMLVNKYFNNILRFYNFSDHYDYHKNQKQIGKILQKNSSCLGLVTTLKDYVKIIQLPNLLAQRPIIYVVDIDLRIDHERKKTEAELLSLILEG